MEVASNAKAACGNLWEADSARSRKRRALSSGSKKLLVPRRLRDLHAMSSTQLTLDTCFKSCPRCLSLGLTVPLAWRHTILLWHMSAKWHHQRSRCGCHKNGDIYREGASHLSFCSGLYLAQSISRHFMVMLSSTFHTIEHGKTEAYDTAWSKWTQEDAEAARNQATGRGVLFITHFWRSCTIASQAKQCK